MGLTAPSKYMVPVLWAVSSLATEVPESSREFL